MELKIEGRIALVSGGTAGIGFAIAERLAGEGARVLIVGRSEERAKAALARLDALAPGRVAMCTADMTEKEGVASAVEAVRDHFGAPDIAISNVIGHKVTADADGPPPGFFRDVRAEEYAHEFQQLALSAWWLADAVLPAMIEKGWGRIINVGSIVARESMWQLPHILPNSVRPVAAGLYSKLAYRHAGSGVTFNSLLTGSIATERNQAYYTWLAAERGMSYEEIDRQNSQNIPLRRRGQPDEMAAVATFLCSEVAGGISGQSIPISGGTTRHIF
jgi:3-oxoacyl-[acyl-carrier protein] reductase